ncbi:MAG: hypothetical protein LUE97_05015 [Oscillospiraceae bacterium]|nr:hypothetical protein [Oscillospiraceae bacterium]
MKREKMSFETARNIVKVVLCFAFVLCIIALIIMYNVGEDSAIASSLVVVAVICLAAAIVFAAAFLKCPYCGSHIFRKVLRITACPHCHRDLVSGMKVKQGKKRWF